VIMHDLSTGCEIQYQAAVASKQSAEKGRRKRYHVLRRKSKWEERERRYQSQNRWMGLQHCCGKELENKN